MVSVPSRWVEEIYRLIWQSTIKVVFGTRFIFVLIGLFIYFFSVFLTAFTTTKIFLELYGYDTIFYVNVDCCLKVQTLE